MTRSFWKRIISAITFTAFLAVPKYCLANESIFDEVWSLDCSNPASFGLLWFIDENGSLNKLIHEHDARVYEASHYALSDEALIATYHDQTETYFIYGRENPNRVRVQERIRSGNRLISDYRLRNGNESNSLYLCESGDPKSVITKLYSNLREPENVTPSHARAWSVVLTDNEIQSNVLPNEVFATEDLEERYKFDAIYSSGSYSSASGNVTADLDSISRRTFHANYKIDIQIIAFRTATSAERQIQFEESRIYSNGRFSTRPVLFPSCGDASLGSQWDNFAPVYYCRVHNYHIEISVGSFGSTSSSLALTERLMEQQVHKILQLTSI